MCRPCLRRHLLLGRPERPAELGPKIAHGTRDQLDLTLCPLLRGLELR